MPAGVKKKDTAKRMAGSRYRLIDPVPSNSYYIGNPNNNIMNRPIPPSRSITVRVAALIVLAAICIGTVLIVDPARSLNSAQKLAEVRKDAWAELLREHPYKKEAVHAEEEDQDRRDRPDLASHQNALMTMDPSTGQVPVERLMAAHATVDQLLQLRAPIPGVSWEERGPNNVGGRTRALLFDPNDPTNKKVWAGGVYGGLWFTDDITVAAPTWEHVDDMWDNIAVTTIAADPSDPDILYVGTGEGLGGADATRGGGIWKSTDGGASWAHLASTTPGAYNSNSDFHYVNKIVVKANGHVFASTRAYFTNRGGVMRSTNGGSTWTTVLSAYAGAGTSFSWSPDIELASNGDLYAAVGGWGSPGAIYKSTDANNGATGTWADLSGAVGIGGAKRIELASAPSNPLVIYAVAQGGSGDNDVEWFKKSIDGGASWANIAIPRMVSDGTTHFTRSQAWYDLIIGVHPTNPDLVIAGGIDLHRSTNGGSTWTGISHWYGGFSKPEVHADQHVLQFRPGASNEVVFGNDGGIHYSPDAGNAAATPTFSSRNNGYNVTQFYACATKNEVNSNYFLTGAQDNGSQRFTAPQMNATDEVTGGDGAFCHIDQLDPNIQMTAYTNNTIYRSLDGGATFPQLISESSSGHFINPSDYDPLRKILYSAANEDSVKRISGFDGAFVNEDLHISIGGAQVSSLKVSPYNDVVFLGIENGRVYKLSNASTASPTLTRLDNGTTPITTAGWVACIDVGANDNELLVTYSNYGVTSLWETTNGGATWYAKEGNLPDMPIRWAIYNPNNREQVLLGTEVGAWSTDAFGHGTASAPDWDPTNTSLAHTRVDMVKYRPADGLVVVATHGRGLYTTDVFVSSSIADFSISQNFSCTSSLTVDLTDGSLKPEGDWAWDVDNDGTTDYTSRNVTHTYTSPGAYSIKLTVNNGASSITKEAAVVVMGGPPTAYTGCAVAANSNNGNGYGIGIFRVALNDLDNTTPNNDGAYNDYTCTRMTKLQPGTSYDLTVSTGTYNAEAVNAYIDYNNSGVFDAGEEIASFPAAATGTRTLSFTTPASGVTMNTPLRLRVVSKFGSSPTDPCNTSSYGQAEDYSVYFNTPANISVAAKVFLEGPYESTTGLMNDSLRGLAGFPLTDPYPALGYVHADSGNGGTVAPAVLAVTGNNAIVDWVVLELRDANSPATVVASRSALLQRDGDVVALDGVSPLSFALPGGDYHVAVRHRNHLGIMTFSPVTLTFAPVSVDLSTVGVYGTEARKSIAGAFPTQAMWAGDVSFDHSLAYTGLGNDRDKILSAIGGLVATNVISGYLIEDVNLDGKAKYTGTGNDRGIILQNIGGVAATSIRVEQLP